MFDKIFDFFRVSKYPHFVQVTIPGIRDAVALEEKYRYSHQRCEDIRLLLVEYTEEPINGAVCEIGRIRKWFYEGFVLENPKQAEDYKISMPLCEIL